VGRRQQTKYNAHTLVRPTSLPRKVTHNSTVWRTLISQSVKPPPITFFRTNRQQNWPKTDDKQKQTGKQTRLPTAQRADAGRPAMVLLHGSMVSRYDTLIPHQIFHPVNRNGAVRQITSATPTKQTNIWPNCRRHNYKQRRISTFTAT
jgi:hypothetical protein